VTPTGTLFDGDAVYASIPAWDGQLGVMVNKSPLLTRLGAGSLQIDLPDGTEKWFLLDGGFAQADPTQVVLLSDAAMPAEEANFERAEAMLADVARRVTQPGENQEEIRRLQQRAYAERALARGGH
jgi:F-type H+-transporting ATPase subunit epsilon